MKVPCFYIKGGNQGYNGGKQQACSDGFGVEGMEQPQMMDVEGGAGED